MNGADGYIKWSIEFGGFWIVMVGTLGGTPQFKVQIGLMSDLYIRSLLRCIKVDLPSKSFIRTL